MKHLIYYIPWEYCFVCFNTFFIYLQTSVTQQLVTPDRSPNYLESTAATLDLEIHDEHGLVERYHNETHVIVRYQISSIDFDRVSTPFIIGLWILSASIAKICKLFLIAFNFYMRAKIVLNILC